MTWEIEEALCIAQMQNLFKKLQIVFEKWSWHFESFNFDANFVMKKLL